MSDDRQTQYDFVYEFHSIPYKEESNEIKKKKKYINFIDVIAKSNRIDRDEKKMILVS